MLTSVLLCSVWGRFKPCMHSLHLSFVWHTQKTIALLALPLRVAHTNIPRPHTGRGRCGHGGCRRAPASTVPNAPCMWHACPQRPQRPMHVPNAPCMSPTPHARPQRPVHAHPRHCMPCHSHRCWLCCTMLLVLWNDVSGKRRNAAACGLRFGSCGLQCGTATMHAPESTQAKAQPVALQPHKL